MPGIVGVVVDASCAVGDAVADEALGASVAVLVGVPVPVTLNSLHIGLKCP